MYIEVDYVVLSLNLVSLHGDTVNVQYNGGILPDIVLF